MAELAYLSKKDVMSLFAIRDRTFYSWIEKELLFAIDIDGSKRYDVTKALKQKNIDPADVNMLLAKPVQINGENGIEAMSSNLAVNNVENIKQLKNQLEAINAELKDERNKNLKILNQIEIAESHQKLLIEFKDNETKLFELSKARENEMVVAFQDKMKEIVLSVQDNENGQYQKVLEVLNESQVEREKGLKSSLKTSVISFCIMMLVLMAGFIAVYLSQAKKMDLLEQSKEDLKNSSHRKELELKNTQFIKEQEITNKGKDEILRLTNANIEKVAQIFKENEAKRAELILKKDKSYAKDKTQLSNVYNNTLANMQKRLDEITKKNDLYRDDNNDLKLNVKILNLQMKNILEEIVSNKNAGDKYSKEKNDSLEKALKDIQEGLKKINENSGSVLIEDSTE
ncbi:MAG: hypothetical protein COA79_10045 [Planctomycetota bacterium]|nr:MAG: hypothetical protein COA79_10045 [Planctomycetota bacterium]